MKGVAATGRRGSTPRSARGTRWLAVFAGYAARDPDRAARGREPHIRPPQPRARRTAHRRSCDRAAIVHHRCTTLGTRAGSATPWRMAEPDPRPGGVRRIVDPLTDFLHDEAAGGIALAVATVVALVWANTAADGYASVWGYLLNVGTGDVALRLDARHWVNDALMAPWPGLIVGLIAV